jgi:catechol 2,3-dioxygenase-like lactoylglutathione lyase family enzyme
MRKAIIILSLFYFLASCGNLDKKSNDLQIGQIKAFAEMVAADVKPLALSEPMTKEEADEIWKIAQTIATEQGVEVIREPDLIQTQLFPSDLTDEMEVFIFHKAEALKAYRELKKEVKNDQNGEAEARRFGRLLGYPPHYINALLAKNTAFKTLPDFGIQGTNLFLYYKDLSRAKSFYNQTLGLEIISDYGFAATIKITDDSWLTLVDEAVGRHSADEPKTVAIALLTHHLSEWYTYLQTENVPIKYEYKPEENNAHDGFVVIDPEGYLLEFEKFKQHPENEKLMPLLPKYDGSSGATDRWSKNEGFYGTIFWLYYEDMQEAERFLEEKLGLRQIVDQGWAKVYQVSKTGFMGPVDGRRGMHNFTEKKGSSISFLVEDLEGWYTYVQAHQPFPLLQEMYTGKDERYKAFVGIGPGKYYFEFNQFLSHPDNEQISQILNRD